MPKTSFIYILEVPTTTPGTTAPSVNVTVPTNITPSTTTALPSPPGLPSQCKFPKLPFSRRALEDMQIVGNVIHDQTVVSETHCEDLCLREHSCLGFNFDIDDRNDEKHCELLDHVESYIPKNGFRFRLLDREGAFKVSNELYAGFLIILVLGFLWC